MDMVMDMIVMVMAIIEDGIDIIEKFCFVK
jgi:hypothetical protein